ncbi:SDR family oxidoreductase [Actinomadura decatromicini]|uniref:SDR family oxidoreductase n=1 Tax=Actinomadura decatromicini TaxID=2604572 RepID=A0A5D3F619_9ACTN|nr:SDR family oxidoreductase [Actinomadura decatromicini]TYK43120.1 SDR family oxidoreductase [Actinomadura decatromicini]
MARATSRPVALITGGTTGIGLATARVLRDEGFAVVVTGQNPDTLAAAEKTMGDGVIVRRADARRPADAHTLAAEVEDRFGKLDLVFLNAAVARSAPLEAVDTAFYDEHFDVNVKGQFFTLQRVLPMLGAESSVLFSSSRIATRAFPDWSVYSATKGALLALARALAIELAPRGIRVNTISPGPIDTPALSKQGLPPEAVDGFRADMASRVPLGRIGSDDEVARTVAFLASPSAAYITGAEIVVDGGMFAGLSAA